MKEQTITRETVSQFENHLRMEEKAQNTIEKYIRDITALAEYLCGKAISKELAIAYKQHLQDSGYAVRSINSIIASINALFGFVGLYDCRLKSLKIQKQIYCPEEKELTKAEYTRLVNTARQKGNERLNLVLQTICGTGIRVSELQYITVEAAKSGEAVVSLKGKTRTVFIVRELRQKLLRYAKSQKICTGAIFITRSGKPMSRTNLWREMKKTLAFSHLLC